MGCHYRSVQNIFLIVLVSSLTRELFINMINFQIFEDFLGISLLDWFLLYSIWSEELGVSSILGYLLRPRLAERWPAGECSVFFRRRTWWPVGPWGPAGWQCSACLSHLCWVWNLHILSITQVGVFKFLPLIVNLSVSLFISDISALWTCIIRCTHIEERYHLLNEQKLSSLWTSLFVSSIILCLDVDFFLTLL